MTRPLSSIATTVASAGLAAGCAMLLAAACGPKGAAVPKLAKAGTTADDGSGVLARASIKFLTSDDEGGFEPEQPQERSYSQDYYGGYTYGGFGGDWYGGTGGSQYAGYQPYAPYPQTNRTPDYAVVYGADGGAIEGDVKWPKAPKIPATLTGPKGCPTVDNDSLRLGASNTVEGAVVYLEKITSGRSWGTGGQKPLYIGGTVEMRGCGLTPSIQVLGPIPAPIQVSNADDLPIDLVIERPVRDAVVTPRVEYRLENGASRSTGIDAAGVAKIVDKDGALPPAWVVTQAHPYYTLTDASGRFRLDDIVPGDYTLVVWHAPVVTGVTDGVAQYGEPVVVKKKVTVKKTASTKLKIEIP